MPPNIHADYDIVPGMKVVWDGIPINDFLEEFMRPLDMGLGQIVQDGFSLLSRPVLTASAPHVLPIRLPPPSRPLVSFDSSD